jgi:Uncharacterized protein conserved in bacteria
MDLGLDGELIRGIWGYHWWGNRKHFDEVAALGEDTAKKEVGKQFSFPTLKGMLAHIYGGDRIWFERWKGSSPTKVFGDAEFLEPGRSPEELGRARGRAEGLHHVPWDGRPQEDARLQGGGRQARPACPSGRCSSTWSTTRPIIGARSRPW